MPHEAGYKKSSRYFMRSVATDFSQPRNFRLQLFVACSGQFDKSGLALYQGHPRLVPHVRITEYMNI